MLKLHIGCGPKRLAGYINIDVRADSGADMICDAWDLPGIETGSVDEIYTRHMLEHLDPNDARLTMARWAEVMKPGGRVNIVVPDIEFHARQLLGEVSSTVQRDQWAHAMAGFFGWRDESRGGSREDAHRWGYTAKTLGALLTAHGFTDVVRRVTGADSEPWHLNILAWRS